MLSPFITLAATCLASISPRVAAQDHGAAFDLAAVQTRVVAADVSGQEVRASGPGWRARFDGDGLALTPFGGAAWRLTVDSLWRERELVARWSTGVGGLGPWELGEDGGEVRRRLAAGAIEVCALRRDGVKQSVELAAPPAGVGELRLRMRVSTSLDCTGPQGGGMRFTAGDCEVRVGEPLVYDAAGRSTLGAMHFDGTFLEIRVPERFVDGATYPLVIDPLISPLHKFSGTTAADGAPDCAFDPITSTWLVAWSRPVTTDRYSVLMQRFTVDGDPLGPAQLLKKILLAPDDAYTLVGDGRLLACVDNGDGQFVVVAHEADLAEPASSGQDEGVWCQPVDPLAGVVESAILAPFDKTPTSVDLGGGGGHVCLAFTSGEGVHTWTFSMPLGVGFPGDPRADLATTEPGVELANVRISSRAGASGRWLAVWEQRTGPRTEVHGRALDLLGHLATPATVLMASSNVSYRSPAVTGDGATWHVACVSASSTQQSVLVAPLGYTAGSLSWLKGPRTFDLTTGFAPGSTAGLGGVEIERDSGHAALAWTAEVASGWSALPEHEVRAVTFDLVTMTAGGAPQAIGALPFERLRIASSPGGFLLVAGGPYVSGTAFASGD